MQIINPATEEIICEIPEYDKETIERSFQMSRMAQPAWQVKPLVERIQIIRKFSVLLEQNIETLASVLTSETGKPLQQSRNEINGGRSRIKWLCDNAAKYLEDESMGIENGMEEKIVYEALGVVCNISAWNYPYLVGINVFIPALIAGNAVVYKPSEFATLTGLEIGKLLHESGIPKNIFDVVVGGSKVGELLLTFSFDGYFFTGSYHTGKTIYEKVASKMIPCQCEMGGKDPLYVAEDIINIKQVASATADGAFYNNGQSCCAVERIYVHEKIYDRYIEEFINEVSSWKTGPPIQEGIYIGPVTRKEQLNLLEKQVAEAVEKGAKVLVGGKRMNGKGYFFEPTVLVSVDHSMLIMKEESFGPAIGIMKVRDDEEAIQLMQDTEYGLTAAVYSSDKTRATNILKQIDAGTGYWNCCDRVSAALPWSGRKHSGFGVTLSYAGIRAFVKPKAYHFKNSE
ncbi:MAG: aldehyde dehydrogenase family protein [Ginsengibacter sp.]